MRQIQSDTMDLDAAALVAELKRRLPEGEHSAQAAAYLKDWNGDMHADSQAAAIFSVWMRHFRQAVFADELHGSWNDPQAKNILRDLGDDVRLDYVLDLLKRNDRMWCDDSRTPEHETCDNVLAATQNSAFWELYKLKGDWSMASWRWGDIQSTTYAHTLFSQWKPLTRLFERRVGNGGSENSINVASSSFNNADGYLQIFGAGFRQVIALKGDRTEHFYMNSTGQSGNVMSPHYDDMVVPFRDASYRSLKAAPSTPAASQGRE
jgi:penicillin G amidase